VEFQRWDVLKRSLPCLCRWRSCSCYSNLALQLGSDRIFSITLGVSGSCSSGESSIGAMASYRRYGGWSIMCSNSGKEFRLGGRCLEIGTLIRCTACRLLIMRYKSLRFTLRNDAHNPFYQCGIAKNRSRLTTQQGPP
jgi:hypothetical protein